MLNRVGDVLFVCFVLLCLLDLDLRGYFNAKQVYNKVITLHLYRILFSHDESSFLLFKLTSGCQINLFRL